jgi:hypothetical protein
MICEGPAVDAINNPGRPGLRSPPMDWPTVVPTQELATRPEHSAPSGVISLFDPTRSPDRSQDDE